MTVRTFRCPDGLAGELDAYALRHDLTCSQVIRKALREYLERNPYIRKEKT